MDSSEPMGNILRLKAFVRDFDRGFQVNYDKEEQRKVKPRKYSLNRLILNTLTFASHLDAFVTSRL